MKALSLLDRSQLFKKYLKGTRFIVVIAIAAVLVVSTVSASIYTTLQKRKQPVAEEVHGKPATSATKVEPQSTAVAEEKPAALDNTQPASLGGAPSAPAQAGSPAAKQAPKPRPHTSEDPAYVACTQKYSELYAKYNADNAGINAEKNLALATVDELYNSGFYAEMYSGDTEPYNHWQMDRAELKAIYDNRLSALYNAFAANSSAYQNC